LRDGAEIYRQLSASTAEAALRDVAAEHQNLMNLAIDRQSDQAVAALADHLRMTVELLLDSLPA
jgi:DNA-binding GntR family transcriptional regulator